MREIQTQAETFALRIADTIPRTKLYRGVNIDTTQPGFEKVHDLITRHGLDHPEIGRHLLNALEGTNRREKAWQGLQKGLGGHWTTDIAQAEPFARWPNEETGKGGNLQAVIEADWDGSGEDPDHTATGEFNHQTGERIRSFPWEKEHTLSPGTQINVTGLKIRPHDSDFWDGPAVKDEYGYVPIDENHDGPWHYVLGDGPQARRA